MPKPPKRFWIISLIIVVCVAAVALAALMMNSRPKPELVTVAFVGYTNDSGRRVCMFRGTNGSGEPITYWAHVEAKSQIGSYYATTDTDPIPTKIPAGRSFTFSLDAPASGSTWRLY